MPSPAATNASVPCPHYPQCVSCELIGNAYGEQLRLKHATVREAFASYATLAALDVPAVIGSPQAFGYRNQAKLVVRRARRGVLLGVYRPGSHRVADIRDCPVHHPLINHVLAAIAHAVEHYEVTVYDERTGHGSLRYVVVRVSSWTKAAQVILVTATRALPHMRDFVRALRQVRGVVSVVQNINDQPGNVILGPTFVPLTQENALIERIGVLKLKTHAGAFLQANVPVARKLYERALQWATPDAQDVCVDLYCGVGAMTFYLATAAKLVFGIEESPVAVTDAKANIRLNGFHNVRFQCGDASHALPELAGRLGRVDIVTLNPPRKGADESARRAIVACAPKRIVYISCEPATLARDLDWITEHGYRPLYVQPFDMLPQTKHVECVAALEAAP